jgi:hypothetical protein
VLFYIVISAILDFLFQEQSLFVRSKLALFRFLRKIPAFRNYVEGKLREPLAVGFAHVRLVPQAFKSSCCEI